MSNKPIFVATHPRACSTAFERVFMTQSDKLQCIHEPFGDAFYFGPERLSTRYEEDVAARSASGYSDSTFKTIFDRIEEESREGKRVFIKDITHYLLPPDQQVARIAPSLQPLKRGVGTTDSSAVRVDVDKDSDSDHDSGVSLGDAPSGRPFPFPTKTESDNPTVVPRQLLEQFHFTFLIRHPRCSIPSYYRCCNPPLVERTQFHDFMPSEAGYDELRRFFEFCREANLVGPKISDRGDDAGDADGTNKGVEICVIDADDLLDDPKSIVKKYCKSVGLEYDPSMLIWDDEASHQHAKAVFQKWDGFHDDAINSKDLKPRTHKKAPKSDEQLFAEWKEKYGEKAAEVIRDTVQANVADYEYLKQFAIKP